MSTVGQDHGDQVAELEAAGCERIYAEQASAAAGRKRGQLARAIAALQPGDVLTVTRLSRLARSTRDALNFLAEITAKGAAFRSLRETWADSTTPAGRFLVSLTAALAELDREMILERTAEGRASAKARGVRLGRRPTLSAAQALFVLEARRARPPTHSIGQLVALLNVSRSTVCRAARGADRQNSAVAIQPPAEASRQLDLEDFTGGPG